MINDHPQNVDEMFEQQGYERVTPKCDHTPTHVVYRHPDGVWRCTSGQVVAPKVADVEDRIGSLLQREVDL